MLKLIDCEQSLQSLYFYVALNHDGIYMMSGTIGDYEFYTMNGLRPIHLSAEAIILPVILKKNH